MEQKFICFGIVDTTFIALISCPKNNLVIKIKTEINCVQTIEVVLLVL